MNIALAACGFALAAGLASERQASTVSLRVRVFDGARRPLSPGSRAYLRIFDGSQRRVIERFFGGDIDVRGIPVRDNLDDSLRVVVAADRYGQAGSHPVRIRAGDKQTLDLMLLREDGRFDFSASSWEALRSKPALRALVSAGASEDKARERYERLMREMPAALAAILNMTAALAQIELNNGDALSYFDSLIWDGSMKKDRFYAYVDGRLLDDVREAAGRGLFGRVRAAGLFHPDTVAAYKQKEFANANVQLSFYLRETVTLKMRTCMKVEVDMDYYTDSLSHFLLEVLPHKVSAAMTDPRTIYQLRWIAGRRAGASDFDPGYTIE